MAQQSWSIAIVSLLFALAWARPAAADCTNDTDCPGPTCGSEVCQWSVAVHTCVPAGTDVPGFDGWCTIDANCKCLGQGATCATAVSHCTFTVPQDAGVAAADAGASSAGTATGPPGCAIGRSGSGASASMMALGCAAALALVRRRRRSTRPARG